jgi:maltose alpha-D-glucosyltransferase / alpha-amylase
VVTNALQRDIEELDMQIDIADAVADGGVNFYFPLAIGELLGRRTSELHHALAAPTDNPDFAVESITKDDLAAWSSEAADDLVTMFKRLESALASLPQPARDAGSTVLEKREALTERVERINDLPPSGGRSRIHGDYHLGQVLVARDDLVIIDFEGEPRRTIEQRRSKSSPLRDVAGMLRSLDYAASAVLERGPRTGAATDDATVRRLAEWREFNTEEFFEAYRERIAGCPTWPEKPEFAKALLDMFTLQKAAYEVAYELANRPSWVTVPLTGLLDILDAGAGSKSSLN